MLNVYISYAKADQKTLDRLLIWLKPLQEKYFLHVWYDHPMPRPKPLPFIWQLLLFWYTPPKPNKAYHPDLPRKVSEAHLYIFLTSYNSLATPHINDLEVPAANDRYVQFGKAFIRICHILVSPSKWDSQSRLSGFPVLGPAGTLAKTGSEEEAFQQIITQLEKDIVELRSNWVEEHHRVGLPVDTFFKPASKEFTEPEITPLPDWVGWIILFAILYLVTSWYTTYCAPRQYYRYKPEYTPYQTRPVPYLRDFPVQMPDTSGIPPQEEKTPVKVIRDTVSF